MKIDVAALGRAISEKRERDGVNQWVPADAVGIAQSNISRIERGHGNVTADLYARLCNWLGVPLDAFVVETEAA